MNASVRERTSATGVTVRVARPSDASIAGTICYTAFKSIAEQHGFPPDFPSPASAIELMTTLLCKPHVHAVVAEREGRVVGSNFLWEDASIAGVGPITVHSEAQNAQIGRSLMCALLERADRLAFAGVRLVQAAYHQRSLALYTKLGFDVREPLSNLQGPPLAVRVPGHSVRAAREDDLPNCNTLCRRVHGHDRCRELAAAMSKRTATVVERDDRITGYATLIGFFGHAVAETNDDLKALIGAARSFEGPGFLLPTRNATVLRWCLQQGLRLVQPMSLMTLGFYREPAGAYLPSILL